MESKTTYYFKSDDGVVEIRSKSYTDREQCEADAKDYANDDGEVIKLFRQRGSKAVLYGSIG